MTEFKWIKESGQYNEESLKNELASNDFSAKKYIAYSVDQFLVGYGTKEQIANLNIEKLLALRVFSESEEFYYYRSMIGDSFEYRKASEEGLDSKEFLVKYQTLDINRECSDLSKDDHGNMHLYTTVGGKYAIPINREDNSAKIVAYLNHDEHGMAKIVDYRMCCFCNRDYMEG